MVRIPSKLVLIKTNLSCKYLITHTEKVHCEKYLSGSKTYILCEMQE